MVRCRVRDPTLRPDVARGRDARRRRADDRAGPLPLGPAHVPARRTRLRRRPRLAGRSWHAAPRSIRLAGRAILRGRLRIRYAAVAALGLFAAAGPAVAHASTAPPVPWCGTGPSSTDRPDAVAGRQIHVIYAL